MSATHNLKAPAEQAQPDETAQAEEIVDPARIVSLLRRMQQARTLLTVSFPQVSECFNSSLLSIQPQHGSMVLDELTPLTGHAHLLRLRTPHIQARLRGVDINFSTELLEAGVKAGIAYYRIALPSMLIYAQRRANFRARLGAGRRVPVTIETEQGQILKGHLCDISASGLCASFGPPVVALAHGDPIPRCLIRFEPGDEVSSKMEVRFVNTGIRSGLWRVGGRFIDIERMQVARVERYVTTLDREMRKKDVALK